MSGTFDNLRCKYHWQDKYVVEVDETSYDHGTAYEIELEHVNAHKIKAELERLLTGNDIKY